MQGIDYAVKGAENAINGSDNAADLYTHAYASLFVFLLTCASQSATLSIHTRDLAWRPQAHL